MGAHAPLSESGLFKGEILPFGTSTGGGGEDCWRIASFCGGVDNALVGSWITSFSLCSLAKGKKKGEGLVRS